MPYIHEGDRIRVRRNQIECPGDLNFHISDVIDSYISKFGLSYSVLNAVIGALECTKLELYRRIASPYEDKKLIENGEVYVKTRP